MDDETHEGWSSEIVSTNVSGETVEKTPNVAILQNSHAVKSITYVSPKTWFKVFRQFRKESSFSQNSANQNVNLKVSPTIILLQGDLEVEVY